ncbi:INO80 complex subunit E [Portunus trituberculatus]|uniref:INO80 complex subunit E n=1 Tax=Portunus trituberculatus TaxID=210409 RepID=A0A5B7G6R6_PORTR|nr:INO80 complex subunit E [Portunus trituberculatus]
MPVQTDGPEDYKAKYKTLKRKLKLLIYENECFQEELRKAQRALLRVRRDKSFLLDRLLQYQRGPDSSSDSEQTEDSDVEVDAKGDHKRYVDKGARWREEGEEGYKWIEGERMIVEELEESGRGGKRVWEVRGGKYVEREEGEGR